MSPEEFMEYKVTPEQLGEKIKILRKNAKYTQEAFSELIGIEPQNLSRIERGLNYPSLATFINMSKVLEVMPNDLLDVEHLCDEKELDEELSSYINDFDLEKKRLLYRMVKIIAE